MKLIKECVHPYKFENCSALLGVKLSTKIGLYSTKGSSALYKAKIIYLDYTLNLRDRLQLPQPPTPPSPNPFPSQPPYLTLPRGGWA